MLRPLILLLAGTLGLASAACRDHPLASGPAAADLRVQPAALVLQAGETATLSTTALDWNGRPLPPARVRFFSSKPEVATVDSITGVVTAVAPGAAEITVHARPRRVLVPVTVEIRGGTAVADFGLEAGEPPVVVLDTWSLATQYVRFRARNAAGESLCGVVPLSVESDTPVFAARYQPPAGAPCLLTMIPRAEGEGWLRVRAGGAADSAWVRVHRTRYRWAFGATYGTHTVATPVRYEFAVIGENGGPVAGVPVVFHRYSIGEPVRDTTVRTGPDGFARVEWTLPTYPITRTEEGSGGTEPSYRRVSPTFAARVEATLPDGTMARDSSVLAVRPDAPDHIEVIVLRSEVVSRNTAWVYSTRSSRRLWRLSDYQHTLFTYESRVFVPYPSWSLTVTQVTDTLAAVVADRHGNPTAVVPALVAVEGGAARVVDERDFGESGSGYYKPLSIPGLSTTWHTEWAGGRVAVTDLGAPFASMRLTFAAPGVPPRTLTVVGVDSIP